MAKMVKVRVNPGIYALDAVQVSKEILVTKRWTDVPSTLAKKLVGLEYNGRPKFEFENEQADDAGAEGADETSE